MLLFSRQNNNFAHFLHPSSPILCLSLFVYWDAILRREIAYALAETKKKRGLKEME